MTQSTVEAGQMLDVTIIAPCEFVTANDRRFRYATARLNREWRAAAALAARAARLPVGVDRIRIDAEFRFRGRAPVRDRDNLRPTLKAIIDGLGPARTWSSRGMRHHTPGHGLVVDDSDRHIDPAGLLDIGEPLPDRPYAPAGEVRLLITVVKP